MNDRSLHLLVQTLATSSDLRLWMVGLSFRFMEEGP